MEKEYNMPSITQDGHEWIRVVDHVALVEKAVREERERHAHTLSALATMWNQYCSGESGHEFMGAGECASEVLERYGLLSRVAGKTPNGMYGNLRVDYPLDNSAKLFFIQALTPTKTDKQTTP